MIRQKKESLNSENEPPKQKNSKMALLRLQKDIKAYQDESVGIDFVYLSFPDPQSIQTIHIDVLPQENSPYNKTKISFILVVPDQYPMEAPKLKCMNKIFHPNINYNGSVCLPLVREDWSPTVTLFSIVCGIIFILTYPNADDALEPEIGDMMISDIQLYKKIVKHTVMGRSFQNKNYDNIIYRIIDQEDTQKHEFDIEC